jgi:hypothetical protein
VKEVRASNSTGQTVQIFNNLVSSPITVNNLDTLTNTLNAVGTSTVAGDIINKDFSIEYLGK